MLGDPSAQTITAMPQNHTPMSVTRVRPSVAIAPEFPLLAHAHQMDIGKRQFLVKVLRLVFADDRRTTVHAQLRTKSENTSSRFMRQLVEHMATAVSNLFHLAE